MIKGISIGNYYVGNSLIHRLDPRVKILFSLSVIISLFLIDNYWALLWISGVYGYICLVSQLSFTYLVRGMKPLIIIIVFTFIIHLFFTPGTAIYHLGPISITREGLDRGVFMAYRLILLIGVSVILTATTSPLRLTDGLQNLLSPLKKIKVPTSELALMVSIALRFIPTFISETERIIKAQSSRGVDFYSGNFKERLENLIPILVPLFISSFRRAEDLAIAMEARCYRGEEGRTRLHPLKYKTIDYMAFGLILLYLGVIILLRNI
ncbi:MAG: transporter [Desulfitibacter sp. BRH_c19]|nr:MAG: transporter [Desulfitibacter sp. BRH_c19]